MILPRRLCRGAGERKWRTQDLQAALSRVRALQQGHRDGDATAGDRDRAALLPTAGQGNEHVVNASERREPQGVSISVWGHCLDLRGRNGRTSSPTVGDSRAPYAWSTAKILIVAQTLLDSGGPNNLTEEQRSLISSALASSDNEAAAALHRQM